MLQLPIYQTQGFIDSILARAVLLLLLFITACQKDETMFVPVKTIIVYMIADNNLDYFAAKDINEMEQGFNDNITGNLIVYVDRAAGASPSHPLVYKISNDTSDAINSEITMVYKEQNSASPDVMHTVISDIINKYPAQKYSLILWSHGTAWYQQGTSLNKNSYKTIRINQQELPLTKSFGKDGEDELNIQDLKKALPSHFEFILFDACYMGSIEVLYELKDKTDYIISSPTEILSAGYPYKSMVGELFEATINYQSIANDFFISYDTLDNAMRSATISVVKTTCLNSLASQVALIMNDSSSLVKVDCSEIQQYTVDRQNFLFDLDDYISKVTLNTGFYHDFKLRFNAAVIYKASTSNILDELLIDQFSGLSVFVPDTSNSEYYDFYKALDWYKDCGYCHYFSKFYSGK